MGLSDIIARFIMESIENNGVVEIQRSEIASKFGCVPSQINYVISTRFNPDHGYIVESRRGGGGYIRISRVKTDREGIIMHIISCVGNHLGDYQAKLLVSNIKSSGYITEKEAKVILAAICEQSYIDVPFEARETLRARVFKNMLLNLI